MRRRQFLKTLSAAAGAGLGGSVQRSWAMAQPVEKPGSPNADFYGMIANIDENVGRLLGRLKTLGLEENTIAIFMTDNGTAAGFQGGRGFNAGMCGTNVSPRNPDRGLVPGDVSH